MSDVLTLEPDNGYIANPIFLSLVPKEGPKDVSVTVPFSDGVASGYLIDFTLLVKQTFIRLVQSAFVDNWAGADPVAIDVVGTNMTVQVPAGCQGTFPLLGTQNPKFLVRSTGTTDVKIQFLNVPVPLMVWTPAGSGASSVVVTNTVAVQGTVDIGNTVSVIATPAQETPVAASATQVVTGGTPVTVFPAGAANDYLIQNFGTVDLFVAVGANATTTPGGGNFVVPPNGTMAIGRTSGSITANSTASAYDFAAQGNILGGL